MDDSRPASLIDPPAGYAGWLTDLESRIRQARLRASLAVNRELVLLYWQIGRDILERQAREGWGAKVIERLAHDLRTAFPEMKGLSARNLKYMRAFAEAWPEEAFVQEVLAQLPWYHQLALLDKLKTPARPPPISPPACPPQSDLARESLKDPYRFDFLGLGSEAHERDIENALVDHISRFLIELGAGFAYVGRQVHLSVGGEDFYIDLLFYHLKLRCYVVVELKAGDFRPEHVGKLNFYLSVVDDQMRVEADAPTIGLLLCKGHNSVVAEYALRNTNTPIGVAQYELVASLPDELRTSLPSIEQIERELGGDSGGS